ncbi:MAG TPA: NUDIX hydrolase [Kangiella sp.]|uniref:NUDIX hydrolase n=1 Tax=Kangiella sp. TaxID=1920245 RepID=UPI002F9329ED
MLPVHVTVAAIIEHNNRFLMVEERTSRGEIVFNQPAGHLESDESLVNAIIREVKEETGLAFKPNQLVGTYTLNPATNNQYYQRFCFTGDVEQPLELAPEDDDIIAAHWMTIDDILAVVPQHRTGLIVQCLKDYLKGQRYSLNSLLCSQDELALQRDGINFLKQLQTK